MLYHQSLFKEKQNPVRLPYGTITTMLLLVAGAVMYCIGIISERNEAINYYSLKQKASFTLDLKRPSDLVKMLNVDLSNTEQIDLEWRTLFRSLPVVPEGKPIDNSFAYDC